VLLPWPLAAEVASLAEDEGLGTLIDRHGPLLVACDDAEPHAWRAFADIDTPEDLSRLEGEGVGSLSPNPFHENG